MPGLVPGIHVFEGVDHRDVKLVLGPRVRADPVMTYWDLGASAPFTAVKRQPALRCRLPNRTQMHTLSSGLKPLKFTEA
jgi:hypothetical protein